MQAVKQRAEVCPLTGCWVWQGASASGRPYIRRNGKTSVVYRLLFEEINSLRLDRRTYVCHTCDNGMCCNPDHLFAGTQADNMADMTKKGRHFSVTKPETHRAATAKARAVLAANPALRPRGARHGTKTKPESVKRGEQHWAKKKPHLVRRGFANSQFMFSEAQVEYIVKSRKTCVALAREFGCHHSTVSRARRRWREALESE